MPSLNGKGAGARKIIVIWINKPESTMTQINIGHGKDWFVLRKQSDRY